MPLKRTPPKTPHINTESDANPSSAPVTDTENEGSTSATSKPRARKRPHGEEMSTFMSEMRTNMETFKKQQDTIQACIKDVQQQNIDLIKSMEFISSQYEEMKEKLTKMETERRDHLSYIQTLESKVENLERIGKQSGLEIRNIPMSKKETKEDLLNLVKKVADTVNVSFEQSMVRDVFRPHSNKGEAKPIIIDFTSVLIKESILTSVKSYNRKNKDNKLNTELIQLEGQKKPIFIAECLTLSAKKMYFLARDFSKTNNYAYCWTSHGRVFLRKREGAPARCISKESDLLYLQSHPDL
ncbi:unnamed protein product [Chilo suppressalis]|uniref:FP protein C-terminal domain-containing protein n=1 Tax=Chilo suppressalis TaxID=168631 RepID=A0ABN8BCC3_CHISP|nr:unnamed protein product [Chilo suppressalis]